MQLSSDGLARLYCLRHNPQKCRFPDNWMNLDNRYRGVLFLGEGNFAFSASIISEQCPPRTTNSGTKERHGIYIATSFDSLKVIKERYGTIGLHNIKLLKEKGVKVFHNIDATKLDSYSDDLQFINAANPRKPLLVVFMFPKVSAKGRIDLNRKLLENTFHSIQRLVKDNHALEVRIALARGQGGVKFIEERWGHVRSIRPKDTWQIVEMAARAKFVLTDAWPFDSEYFATYGNYFPLGNRRKSEGRFFSHGATVHVLQPEGGTTGSDDALPVVHRDVLVHPTFIHDAAFWTILEQDNIGLEIIDGMSVFKSVDMALGFLKTCFPSDSKQAAKLINVEIIHVLKEKIKNIQYKDRQKALLKGLQVRQKSEINVEGVGSDNMATPGNVTATRLTVRMTHRSHAQLALCKLVSNQIQLDFRANFEASERITW
eukprot:g4306.t1